ncbi:MAG: 4Fe-4S dicluster domain-containing protein [Ruminococcaceae bacterium]|nr:4Fe-4S dicluster domain-containing protein [Oscillospiraceae bacterium]
MTSELKKDFTYHSVCLGEDLCKGCTTCMRYCPTQAIRVQNGKAKIIREKCIDCGECVRRCPYRAKKVVSDTFSALDNYKHCVALVAPAFCGQFSKAVDINVILTGLKKIGFDDVFEVARGAEVITEKTRQILADNNNPKPLISSACPAVVRLICVRFPSLVDNLIPLTSPMEVAAQLARKEAREKTGLADEEIGIFFISPCPAKVTAVKQPLALKKSDVSGVIAVKDVYMRLAQALGTIKSVEKLSVAGKSGVRWARSGGEAEALGIRNYIAVDGIHNVTKILEELEDEKLGNIDYIEALSCTSGCTGGPLNVENGFVANSRIHNLTENMENKLGDCSDVQLFWDKKIDYKPFSPLDPDLNEAMRKMQMIEEIYDRLPQLDCGSCGSPTCREFAEDIVRGKAQERDCIFRLREKIEMLAKEITELSKMINE